MGVPYNPHSDVALATYLVVVALAVYRNERHRYLLPVYGDGSGIRSGVAPVVLGLYFGVNQGFLVFGGHVRCSCLFVYSSYCSA